jgi:glycine dehydrogenase
MPRDDNMLKNAPHTASELGEESWQRPYSRKQACFPKGVPPARKYWSPVNRIDNVYGDRNLTCVCPPIEEFKTATE